MGPKSAQLVVLTNRSCGWRCGVDFTAGMASADVLVMSESENSGCCNVFLRGAAPCTLFELIGTSHQIEMLSEVTSSLEVVFDGGNRGGSEGMARG